MSDEFDTIHDGIDELGEEPPNPDGAELAQVLDDRNDLQSQLAQSEEARKRAEDAEAKLAKLPADWEQDSSLETWFPLTAQELITLRAERDQWRTVAQELDAALTALREMVATHPATQGRELIGLGVQVNNALAHHRALAAAEPQTNKEQSQS